MPEKSRFFSISYGLSVQTIDKNPLTHNLEPAALPSQGLDTGISVRCPGRFGVSLVAKGPIRTIETPGLTKSVYIGDEVNIW